MTTLYPFGRYANAWEIDVATVMTGDAPDKPRRLQCLLDDFIRNTLQLREHLPDTPMGVKALEHIETTECKAREFVASGLGGLPTPVVSDALMAFHDAWQAVRRVPLAVSTTDRTPKLTQAEQAAHDIYSRASDALANKGEPSKGHDGEYSDHQVFEYAQRHLVDSWPRGVGRSFGAFSKALKRARGKLGTPRRAPRRGRLGRSVVRGGDV